MKRQCVIRTISRKDFENNTIKYKREKRKIVSPLYRPTWKDIEKETNITELDLDKKKEKEISNNELDDKKWEEELEKENETEDEENFEGNYDCD
tara:strand:- start:388 stop:669 length:282 start_codon:yes stop_codon:yes gene_type:complete